MVINCQDPSCSAVIDLNEGNEHRVYVAFRKPVLMDYEFVVCSDNCAVKVAKDMLDTHTRPEGRENDGNTD